MPVIIPVYKLVVSRLNCLAVSCISELIQYHVLAQQYYCGIKYYNYNQRKIEREETQINSHLSHLSVFSPSSVFTFLYVTRTLVSLTGRQPSGSFVIQNSHQLDFMECAAGICQYYVLATVPQGQPSVYILIASLSLRIISNKNWFLSIPNKTLALIPGLFLPQLFSPQLQR